MVAAFALGRFTAAPQPYAVYTWNSPALAPVQFSQQPDDPRELIPLPGQGPSGQPQPVPGQEQGECPLYFYQDGQLFQMRPGEQGPNGPLGQGNPELFPLDPVPPQGPQTPGSPPARPPAPSPPSPGRPPPQQPEQPFFRAPGVASAPSSDPLLIAELHDLDMSRLPGR